MLSQLRTIGKAVGVSRNTVVKYVRSLEEKGLIRTEPTVVRSKDGRLLNGNRLYTICPSRRRSRRSMSGS